MCACMRAKVVRAGKAFGAERALEGGRVFLDPLVCAGGGRPGRVGQFEYVIAAGDIRRGGAAGGFRGGGGIAGVIRRGIIGGERSESMADGGVERRDGVGFYTGTEGAGKVRV